MASSHSVLKTKVEVKCNTTVSVFDDEVYVSASQAFKNWVGPSNHQVPIYYDWSERTKIKVKISFAGDLEDADMSSGGILELYVGSIGKTHDGKAIEYIRARLLTFDDEVAQINVEMYFK